MTTVSSSKEGQSRCTHHRHASVQPRKFKLPYKNLQKTENSFYIVSINGSEKQGNRTPEKTAKNLSIIGGSMRDTFASSMILMHRSPRKSALYKEITREDIQETIEFMIT
jgi:hypothetical protein